MCKVKEKSELKKRALLAKKRMLIGYWDKVKSEHNASESLDNTNLATYLSHSLKVESYKRDTSIELGSRVALEEAELYEKVVEILTSTDIITNPIGMLVDHDIYDKMDTESKQKYILDLSKKFCNLKERYYKEQKITASAT